MKIGGIIAEYNPFHNGHRYLIEEYKKQHGITHLVVAMSGNFVQRGGPSVFEKFSRAEMALREGADLVVEIPAYFATQTAELYARGAVMTLDSLNCLESVCFGSESGRIDELEEVANILVDKKEEFERVLEDKLSKGSFANSRLEAISEFVDWDVSILSKSNNILGLEYIKSLKMVGAKIKPLTVKRSGNDYNDEETTGKFSSATSIRKILTEGRAEEIKPFVPESVYKIVEETLEKGINPMTQEDFFYEICVLSLLGENDLQSHFEIKEGLENSIRKTLAQAENLESVVQKLTTKRYASARIRRCLFNILLGVKDEDIEEVKKLRALPYTRVLGFNKKGTEILKEVKAKSETPVITKPAKIYDLEEYNSDKNFKRLFDFDLRSSNIYYQKYFKDCRYFLKKGEVDYITLKTLMDK